MFVNNVLSVHNTLCIKFYVPLYL